ncbi:class I SAM-dependent methyltransferase [Branchiibius sp. NY16-3462-2]|uniref:class I SAM-dependent methyltransferase n=1 Tax=Branchiibius sp. NY16-3462-2 TaxID=1807500 RepID=UPI0007946CA1|nr:class I SAM-dependent methyltransferase [Branchiibius sp. NY16-3462-2]KYH45876.1 hypothetical protein AZH51_09325 [Branchiibius sp. NY16-3462-2]
MEAMLQQDVYTFNRRDDVAPDIPLGSRSALDVGCGRGGFGSTLRRVLGPEARIVGIEPVPQQADKARGSGFDEVLDGYYPEALQGRDDRFDLICFNDVLEHIVEPWRTLRATHEHLNPGGHVLAAIPNVRYLPVVTGLIAGEWEYQDIGVLDRTHVRFFTKKSMLKMFADAGFEVESVRGANPVFHQSRRHKPLRPLRHVVGSMQWQHYVILARSLRSGS